MPPTKGRAKSTKKQPTKQKKGSDEQDDAQPELKRASSTAPPSRVSSTAPPSRSASSESIHSSSSAVTAEFDNEEEANAAIEAVFDETAEENALKIPDHLPTFRFFYNNKGLTWAYGQLLPKLDDLLRMDSSSAIRSRIESELSDLGEFTVSLPEKSFEHDLATNLYNHLFHTVKQVETRLAQDKVKDLTAKKAAIETALTGPKITEDKKRTYNKKLNEITNNLSLSKIALNTAVQAEKSASELLKPWPDEPEDLVQYMTQLPKEIADKVHVRLPYKPDED